MQPNRDVEYCLRREAEERVAVASAVDPAIRDAHFGMAERYADRAWSLIETIISRRTGG